MFLPVLCFKQEWHVVCQRVRSCYGRMLFLAFFGFLFFLGALCILGVLVLLLSLLRTGLGLHWCASCWTRPLGGGRWRHYLCNLRGECLTAHKTAYMYFGIHGHFMNWESLFLATAGQPILHGYNACMVY